MSGSLRICLVYSPVAREVLEEFVVLAPGSTLANAIHASSLIAKYSGIELATAIVGVWGRKATLDQALLEGDRVEIYRPLTVDPKVARRERFSRQGAKKAGLFVKRRDGAKAGY